MYVFCNCVLLTIIKMHLHCASVVNEVDYLCLKLLAQIITMWIFIQAQQINGLLLF
jgi:hypothetical protein